jgi:hypothetical protein
MNKKPTGKTGFIRIGPNGATYYQTEFPQTKEEIEKFIAEKFVSNLNEQKSFLQIKNFIKNKENDFDFLLDTSIGKKDLDLMEIAPKDLMKNGYSNIPNHYSDIDFGKKVWEKVMEKNKHYGTKKKNLFLLIYPTDFRLNLSELCIQYIKFLANKEKHCFEMIFYFSMLDSNEGAGRLIFPSEINYFDEERYKNNTTYSLL